jgi:chromosome segregation ATPase
MEEMRRRMAVEPATPPPEPPVRSKRVEAGLAAIDELEHERDALLLQTEGWERKYRQLEAEYDALRLGYAQMQTEIDRHKRERDEALEGRVRADTLIDALLTLLRKHKGPTLAEEREEANDRTF